MNLLDRLRGGRLAAVMRLLVLGGTAWLGGRVAQAAVSRGDEVTCLARGASGSLPAGVRWVRADRTQPDAYQAVVGQDWDVVLDVSRQPGQVRGALGALSGSTGHWVFVSSGNVYADHSTPGGDETGRLLPSLQGEVMESMETYGQAKVACEQHVLAAMGADRALIALVGLIGGPGDLFDRSGYWRCGSRGRRVRTGLCWSPRHRRCRCRSSTSGTWRSGWSKLERGEQAGS